MSEVTRLLEITEAYQAVFKERRSKHSFTVASAFDATMSSRICETRRHASSPQM
jgi:hypothetical protein